VSEGGGFHRQKSREGVRCGKKVDFFDDGAVFDQELSVFLRRSAAVKVPTWSEGVDVE
jgi:hypothetical protein